MAEKIELNICLGSSCFARGNKKIVHAIQSYVEDHELGDKVELKGGHCFGNCANGPILKVGDKMFESVNYIDVIDILAKELG